MASLILRLLSWQENDGMASFRVYCKHHHAGWIHDLGELILEQIWGEELRMEGYGYLLDCLGGLS